MLTIVYLTSDRPTSRKDKKEEVDEDEDEEEVDEDEEEEGKIRRPADTTNDSFCQQTKNNIKGCLAYKFVCVYHPQKSLR